MNCIYCDCEEGEEHRPGCPTRGIMDRDNLDKRISSLADLYDRLTERVREVEKRVRVLESPPVSLDKEADKKMEELKQDLRIANHIVNILLYKFSR